MRHEYWVEDGLSADGETIEKKLNELGADGWRLISITPEEFQMDTRVNKPDHMWGYYQTAVVSLVTMTLEREIE